MNSRTKTALAVCLAVSIFAGFVPWFSQANAEFKIKTSHTLRGKINCARSTFDADLDFSAETGRALGKGDTGLIEIFVPSEVRLFNNAHFEGKVTDVQISTGSFGSFKISAVIDQDYCNRKKTLVELSSDRFSSHNRLVPFSCDGVPTESEIRYVGNSPGSKGIEDIGIFNGDIKCSEVPGSPVQNTGTSQSDTLSGTSANNLIDGRGGNDILNGLAGNDKIIGGDGSDKMNGGDGKDFLIGGTGNDELTGGPGPDTFSCGSGTDKIIDFNPSEGDRKTNDCEQF